MSRHSYATFSPVHACFTAAAVALAMLLTGCSGTTTQGVPPSETSTTTALPASAEPSPSVSAAALSTPLVYKPADAHGKAQNVPVPVMPELAKENSEAGLEAFIGYWYAVGQYADQTGDVSVLSTLSASDCKACAYYIQASTDSNRNGRWISGGEISTPKVDITWDTSSATQQATVQVVQESIKYYNADGTEGRPADPATNDAFSVVASFQSTWRVVDTGVIR
ncbi:DUF6318 family protein [Paenarthrobacter ilicis]|uniref:DUF6318 family protein n=1 Tax=Paenarthrobacter ilicis TaxID=43665 RepID=UPI003865AC83